MQNHFSYKDRCQFNVATSIGAKADVLTEKNETISKHLKCCVCLVAKLFDSTVSH